MKAIYIHSRFCPKCAVFKYGRLTRITKSGVSEIKSDEPEKPGLGIIKTVCESVGIPYTEVDVGVEYEVPSALVLTRRGLVEERIHLNPNRVWISETLGMSTIELPGFLIKSKIAKSRYINIEIVTEPPRNAPEALLISQFSAARQVLRNLARTAIEEKLYVHLGNVPIEIVEHLLNKLFPINEEGKQPPDEWKWIEGFIKLRQMRVSW